MGRRAIAVQEAAVAAPAVIKSAAWQEPVSNACLLYTSDAADERSSVDLGGRRIIKKKKITLRRIGHRLV